MVCMTPDCGFNTVQFSVIQIIHLNAELIIIIIIIGEDMDRSKVAHFLWPTVYIITFDPFLSMQSRTEQLNICLHSVRAC